MADFWQKLKKKKGIIMASAPMSGVSDEAFRLMLLKYGSPDVFWTEFVSVDGLFSKGREYCLSVLKHSKELQPIIAQFFGAVPENFQKAAILASELGFDGIDINMGCPDRNIEKQGGGSALIKNPELATKIIKATKRGAGKLPVSVKTRIGYKRNEINNWIPVLLKEKPAVLTVHFRTREELYLPPAHWDLAKEIIEMRDKISPKTLVFGNGDVQSFKQAKELAKKYNLDGIMIGRGLLGNPWFFNEKTPSLKEKMQAIVEHAEIFSAQSAPASGYKNFHDLKKHFHAYTKNFRGCKKIRERLMKVNNLAETRQAVEEFI